MKALVSKKMVRRFLFTGIISLCITCSVSGQGFWQNLGRRLAEDAGKQLVHDLTNKLTGNIVTNGQDATNSMNSHLNKQCYSGTIYVIKLYDHGSLIETAYYCENEYTEFNSCYNYLYGKNVNLQVTKDIIYNNNSSENYASSETTYYFNGRNYSSAEERAAAEDKYNKEQAEIARKAEEEKERKKQEFLADLKGIDTQENTSSLDFKGIDDLEKYAEMLNTNQKPDYHPMPDLGHMTPPDELKKELIDAGISVTATYFENTVPLASEILFSEFPCVNLIVGATASGLIAAGAETAHQYNHGKSIADGTIMWSKVITTGGVAVAENLPFENSYANMAKNAFIEGAQTKLQGGTNKDVVISAGGSVLNDAIMTPVTNTLQSDMLLSK